MVAGVKSHCCSQPGAEAHRVAQAGGKTSCPDLADCTETFQAQQSWRDLKLVMCSVA